MSKVYERISKHVFKARQNAINAINREKEYNRDMNNKNIFGMVNGYIELYNEAWNKFVSKKS